MRSVQGLDTKLGTTIWVTSGQLAEMREPLLTIDEVLGTFRDKAEAQGVLRCIWFIPSPAHAVDREKTRLFSWGFDRDWAFLYRTDSAHVPKLVDNLIAQGKLVTWQEVIDLAPKSGSMGMLVDQFVAKHGSFGFALPVFGPHNHQTLVSATFDTPLSSDEDVRLKSLSRLASESLRLIALIRIQEARDRVRLSERELDVVRELADGQSKKAIARKLGITPSSVDTYSRRIFFKLECDDRVEAVVKALALGLIEI